MIVSKQRFCKDHQRKKKRREEDGSNPKRSDKQTSKQEGIKHFLSASGRQEGKKAISIKLQASNYCMKYHQPDLRGIATLH
jgi:hypothetical protein